MKLFIGSLYYGTKVIEINQHNISLNCPLVLEEQVWQRYLTQPALSADLFRKAAAATKDRAVISEARVQGRDYSLAITRNVINFVPGFTRTADAISMGKLSEKVDVPGAKDEIAVRAKSIDRMRVSMKKLLK